MANERLTLEEMEEKYPDEWLFIVDCEYSENTELLSGRVLVHSPSRADVYEASSRYKGSSAIHCTGKLSHGIGYLIAHATHRPLIATDGLICLRLKG